MKTVLTMISIAWVASLVISFPVIIWNTKTVGNRPINHTHSSDMKKVPATTQGNFLNQFIDFLFSMNLNEIIKKIIRNTATTMFH